jgi:hypothetical protein
MQSKLRAVAAVALLLLIAGVTVAFATSPEDDDDREESVVLDLVAKEVAETFVDLGDKDFSQADQFVFTNDLFRGDTRIGKDGGVCTVTNLTAEGATSIYCSGSNALPGGEVVVQGLVDYAPGEEIKKEPYSLSITGGTGKYRNARGEAIFNELSTKEFRVTLRIILSEEGEE